jgi:hypothetical protein
VANETVTMVTAIAGVTLASLSLGWQAATYHLTGGRAKVTLLVGAMGRGGMFTAEPHKLGSDVFDRMAEQGYRRPIVAVRVANVGRQPITVDRWSLKIKKGLTLTPVGELIGAPMPHRLEVGQSETWAMDYGRFADAIKANREALGLKRQYYVASVDLADGRTATSGNGLLTR